MPNLPDARSNSGDSRGSAPLRTGCSSPVGASARSLGPTGPDRRGRSAAVHKRMLIATAMAVFLIGGSATATATVRGASSSPRPALPPHASTGSFVRSSGPDRADREKIQTAARLRSTALAPRRTARFRAFAAELGLGVLVSIHPLRPGRCATAVTYLYNNLLDLEDAYPGENWNPLRRAVAKEPSTRACTPRPQTPRFISRPREFSLSTTAAPASARSFDFNSAGWTAAAAGRSSATVSTIAANRGYVIAPQRGVQP